LKNGQKKCPKTKRENTFVQKAPPFLGCEHKGANRKKTRKKV